MANTFFGLTIASTGLNASNVSINTTAHNIANVNTKGYTKQVANLQASSAIRVYNNYGTVGTGVTVASIDQLRSSYYDTKYWNNNSLTGQYASLKNYTEIIEDYLDEFNLEGFTSEYTSLFTSLNSLTTNSDSESYLNTFINSADSISQYFNTLSTNLSNLQRDSNAELKTVVNKINSISEQLASLNKQINTIEFNGGTANDLRDTRANLVDQLSAYINVDVTETTYENGTSDYKVRVNGQTLVDCYDYNSLVCTPRETGQRRNTSDIEGLYDISWDNGLPFNMYNDSLKGSLKALIDVRDGCCDSYDIIGLKDADGNYLKGDDGKVVNVNDLSDAEYQSYVTAGYEKSEYILYESNKNSDYKGIPYYQSQLNNFAQTFANSFNEILATGDWGDATPVDFFTSKYGESYITAASMSVNSAIIADNTLLPTTYDDSVGASESQMFKDLYALRSETTINNTTFEGYLYSIVTSISVDSSRSQTFYKNYANIGATIDNQRTSVSGVDEDEEGVDLVKFQNAYNLSSKMISVMNEIYNKLINETGV